MDLVTEGVYALLWTYKGWFLYRPFTHLSFSELGPEEAHIGPEWGSRGDAMLWGECNMVNPFGTRQTHFRPLALETLVARDTAICPRCLHRVSGYAQVYAVAP